jgi:hypothetical protein
MGLNRAVADDQTGGDSLVGEATSRESKYFQFTSVKALPCHLSGLAGGFG